MENKTGEISEQITQKGMSRREFIKLCGIVAAVLGLPASAVNTISNALAAATRLPVIWLEFQDCTGDSESRSVESMPYRWGYKVHLVQPVGV